MQWKHVRLNFEAPPGWSRLDDVDPLTFEARDGLRLRMIPLSVPPSLDEADDAEPLLGWALEQLRSRLGGPTSTRIFPCRFGLCASLRYDRADAAPLQLWVLASRYHALMVSLDGRPNGEELGLARRCVESMHLVSAAQYVS